MNWIKNNKYPCAILTQEDIDFCKYHASLMCKGAPTYSFKHSQSQSEDAYLIGKIGELCIHNLLRKYKVPILHIPFRNDYSVFDWNDDFIISTKNNQNIQLEVRTKARNVNIQDNYECCSDSIKPHLIYVFNSFNRLNNHCFVAGYANWNIWKQHGQAIIKGTVNHNFTHKVNEFQIKTKFLSHVKDVVEGVKCLL